MSIYPTPTKKRNRKKKTKFGGKSVQVDDSKATIKISNIRGPRPASKAWKKFTAKVHKVLDDPRPTGYYKQINTIICRQVTLNQWSIIFFDSGNALGGNPAGLEIFTPRQFKDAEAVLFNSKTAIYNSWATTLEGNNANFKAQSVTHIRWAKAAMRFKNVSQHKAILEMYICKGNNGNSPGGDPITDWNTSLLAGSQTVFNGLTTQPADYLRTLNAPITFPKPFLEMWHIKKITFEFEPGEEAFHLFTGPSNYLMNGSKKVDPTTIFGTTTSPTWLGPENQGCGQTIFFRMLNAQTILTATGGDIDANTNTRTFVGHPPNVTPSDSTAGGIVIEFIREYAMTAPEGVLTTGVSTLKVNNNYHVPLTVITDIEIDADQPHDVPANPN